MIRVYLQHSAGDIYMIYRHKGLNVFDLNIFYPISNKRDWIKCWQLRVYCLGINGNTRLPYVLIKSLGVKESWD